MIGEIKKREEGFGQRRKLFDSEKRDDREGWIKRIKYNKQRMKKQRKEQEEKQIKNKNKRTEGDL
jgi:hypothetical protein